ncbi:Diaminopimelate epimerase-like protein [Sistotremastrum suecicum HHB10207 ss-3]|uniref:trans-L-3-hydroxyproline dehydratase n=1 Tax=Sistotremastrum suecicum HHB10207 ss-3 TaxID=1314776 RepID=A0A166I9G5_9AGAM|nr:Diaminopimelate epimerase-like protein [Sistotremastrum suecicum HHB10207 ss-3]
MDVFAQLSSGDAVLKIVDMHTCGEPTRIVIQGFPSLSGVSLLQKRASAKAHHDDIRQRLMLEPRGHHDMYGAILVSETEEKEADIGVLFCHNEGFSTMCGHATIALGRFLIDTHDLNIFPNRDRVVFDPASRTSLLKLHAPCGLVQVSIPTLPPSQNFPLRSDPSRPVSFESVPSFVAVRDLVVTLPINRQWPQLISSQRDIVRIDIAYGGAFYALVTAQELGFSSGLCSPSTIAQFDHATRLLKMHVQETSEYSAFVVHPTEPDLGFLYSVIVVDQKGPTSELGLCFFADQELDRSPTGSGVCARVALAIAKHERDLFENYEYHSVVSHKAGAGSFVGTAIERTTLQGTGRHFGRQWDAVKVRVSGNAFYTSCSTMVLERGDSLSASGFTLSLPEN